MRDDKEPKEKKSRPRFPDESEGAKERRGGHIINIRPPSSLHTRRNLIKKMTTRKRSLYLSAPCQISMSNTILFFYFKKIFFSFSAWIWNPEIKNWSGKFKMMSFWKMYKTPTNDQRAYQIAQLYKLFLVYRMICDQRRSVYTCNQYWLTHNSCLLLLLCVFVC
jgi:hypothetical protein